MADINILRSVYYKNYFPYLLMKEWLEPNIEKRTFSFVVRGDFGPVFVKEKFKDYDAFSYYLRETGFSILQIHVGPMEIEHIGPEGEKYKINEKEFVIDMDIGDWPVEAKFCQCDKSRACKECFRLAKIGTLVYLNILEEDFGMKQIYITYSGNRGIHIWVLDEEAKKYSDIFRKHVAHYIYPWTDNKHKNDVKRQGGRMHPTLRRIYNKYLIPFSEMWIFPGMLLDKYKKFSTAKLITLITAQFSKSKNVNTFLSEINMQQNLDYAKFWNIFSKKTYLQLKENIIFYLCYPRLDQQVTISSIHLLRLPFGIHNKTNRLCFPLDVKSLMTFNCDDAPNLGMIRTPSEFTKTLNLLNFT